jgi:transcriptional regulator with XRE-family HTH domain
MSFGAFIKAERKRQKVSLRDLAEKTKTTMTEVQAWEDDKRLPPGPQMSRLKFVLYRVTYHPSYRLVHADETSSAIAEADTGALSDDVKRALTAFMSLSQEGGEDDTLLENLRVIWPRKLENLGQLEAAIDRHVQVDRVPVAFRRWWEERKQKMLEPLPPPMSRPLVPGEPDDEVEARKRELREWAELEAAYEKDNSDLRVALGQAQANGDRCSALLDDAFADLTKARAELEQVRAQAVLSGLAPILNSFKILLKAGVFDEAEVGAKLVALIKDK